MKHLLPSLLAIVFGTASAAEAEEPAALARTYLEDVLKKAPAEDLAAQAGEIRKTPGAPAALLVEAGTRANLFLYGDVYNRRSGEFPYFLDQVEAAMPDHAEECIEPLRSLMQKTECGAAALGVRISAKLKAAGPLAKELADMVDTRDQDLCQDFMNAFVGCADPAAWKILKEHESYNWNDYETLLGGLLRTVDPEARPYVRSILVSADRSSDDKFGAVRALTAYECGFGDGDALRACLVEGDDRVIYVALPALVKTGQTPGVELLRRVYSYGGGWCVDESVAKLMAQAGDEEGAMRCIELARDGRPGMWENAALTGLKSLTPEFVESLRVAEDPRERNEIISALAELGDISAAGEIARWLDDEEMHGASSWALGKLAASHPGRLQDFLRTAAESVEKHGWEYEEIGKAFLQFSGEDKPYEAAKETLITAYVSLALWCKDRPRALKLALEHLSELADVDGVARPGTAEEWRTWWKRRQPGEE